MLMPLLPADLERQWLPEIVATDAAPQFGFGVCAYSCTPDEAAQVGRLSDRRGDYVRLFPEDGDEPEVPRQGRALRLSMHKSSFRQVICSKAQWQAHSSVLEGHGVLLGVKWCARSPTKHHKRLAFLVDARAIIGAAAKGRTSARAIRGVIRSLGSHCLAADLLLRCCYIPSESNPADDPSRGVRRKCATTVRHKGKVTRASRFGTKSDRSSARRRLLEQRLAKCGHDSDTCDDAPASSRSSS